MNLLLDLKCDFRKMLALENEYGQLYASIMYHLVINDELNYNPELADKMNKRIIEIGDELTELKNKWGI